MTKLHKTTTALLLTATLLLSGCAERRNGTAQGEENFSSNGELAESIDDHNSSDLSEPVNSGSDDEPESYDGWYSGPDLQKLIERLPFENVSKPGGNSVSKYEASRVYCKDGEPCFVGFDFVYLSDARRSFHNTIDEPELFDTNTLEFKGDPTPANDLRFFRVKAGDKLENGLVVKLASSYSVYGADVEFDGQITLDGILWCYDKDFSYNEEGCLRFLVDTTKCDHFPLIGIFDEEDCIPSDWIDNEEDFAFVGSEASIFFKNFDSLDLSDIISPGKYIKARITIKDLSKYVAVGIRGDYLATLVSVDPIT